MGESGNGDDGDENRSYSKPTKMPKIKEMLMKFSLSFILSV